MMRHIYEVWSSLLTYPGESGAARAEESIAEICRQEPERSADLEALRQYAAANGDSALEEIFARTFENNAERALELGWHLHGESYSRGSFMVRLRQQLRANGVEESIQLPDHLTHVLCLLSVVDDDSAKQLTNDVLLPALAKIEAGFSQPGNPYHGVIAGLNKHLGLAHALSLPQTQQEADDNE